MFSLDRRHLHGHYPHVSFPSSEGVSALHVCCAQDPEGACVQYLLGHKALPSLLDGCGYNALHYAAAVGSSHALEHLLDFGGSELFFRYRTGQAGQDSGQAEQYIGRTG